MRVLYLQEDQSGLCTLFVFVVVLAEDPDNQANEIRRSLVRRDVGAKLHGGHCDGLNVQMRLHIVDDPKGTMSSTSFVAVFLAVIVPATEPG